MSDEEVEDVEDQELDEDEVLEDEDNSDAELFEEEEEPKAIMKRSKSFEVIPQTEIVKESKHLIEDSMAVCGIPTMAAATILLRYFKWNKEKLIEGYMEDPEKVATKAGMTTFDLERPVEKPNAVFSCLICLEDLPASETFALGCGHRYCKDCWAGYLNTMLVELGAKSVSTKCPAPKCGCIVHEEAFKKLLDAEHYKKYEQFLLRSFVEDSYQTKWCPFPGCTNAIHCERPSRKQPVECKCGLSWCFRCCDSDIGDHRPVACEFLDKWVEKASAESENVKWLIANTKKCPKCCSHIEKNGGCMHMTCKQCTYEFCWLCRGDWKDHGSHTGGYYQCNKYDASDAKKDDEKATDAKNELETYMFYFHRYDSHKSAGKIAEKQKESLKKREDSILAKFNVRAQDTKFLLEAVEQLIKNRRVLQYSFVMGYYLDKSKVAEKNLFEYLQEDLEKHTNYLSELYERDLNLVESYQQFMKWKEDVTNYTRVTKKFLDNFLDGTAEGLTFVS